MKRDKKSETVGQLYKRLWKTQLAALLGGLGLVGCGFLFSRSNIAYAGAPLMVLGTLCTVLGNALPLRHWKCPECGAGLGASARGAMNPPGAFCPHCGERFDKEDQT